MKIKMYTKVTCYPLNGTKIIWVTYDSVDDINIVDGEDKITSAGAREDEETVRTYKKNTKITRHPFLTGGKIPQLGYHTFIAVNPVELIKLWSNNLDKDYDGNIHSETFLRK